MRRTNGEIGCVVGATDPIPSAPTARVSSAPGPHSIPRAPGSPALTHAPIRLHADPTSPLADRVRAAARALRVDVDVAAPGQAEPARIGDVTLAPDAEGWRIEAALLRALAPRHILFLCVANSARSQLGEGIARSLAADGVRISSAGSEPSSVRPQAVRVLAEIGIDAGGQTSKGVDDVDRPVDAVITLCAEEVCPVWLEDAWRLHWGLPDPAGVEGAEEEKLEAFRAVRDQLRRRLAVLLDSA